MTGKTGWPGGRELPASLRAVLLGTFLLFAAVGALVVDDYGASGDNELLWQLAAKTTAYVLEGDDALLKDHFRNDGAVFTVAAVGLQGLLGLEDSRDRRLGLYMTSHLFFLFAGVMCAILSYRVTGSRAAACVALLIFVLHPRLYAHSFFNARDIPFLVMFMMSLLLIHRAFAKDTAGAFAICGACLALAFNMRVMGFVLVLAVLGMRGLDWRFAASRAERKRLLATAGVFLATAAVVVYATRPYLWTQPMAGMFQALRWVIRTINVFVLFDGEARWIGDLPWRYIPTWIGQTSPPFTLLLGLAGTAVALGRLSRKPGEALRNTPVRFLCLCLVASWGAVAALALGGANLHHGWRPLYFLFAPFSVLAALGMGTMLAWARGPMARRAVGGLALAAAGSTGAAMAEIHPYQNVYFNAFVDRETPEHLRKRYEMDFWATSYREALEYLLNRHPGAKVDANAVDGFNLAVTRLLFPPTARARLTTGVESTGDYHITHHAEYAVETLSWPDRPFAPLVYTRQVSNNTIMSIVALDVSRVDEHVAQKYREAYNTATAGRPIADGDVRFFLDGRRLSVVQEACPRRSLSSDVRLALWREGAQEDDFVVLRTDFGTYGVLVDGDCWMKIDLPWRPSRLAGYGRIEKQVLWRADFDLEDP